MPKHLFAEEGPLRGTILNLEEGNDWIIGRSKDANFLLDDTSISRKHAHIFKDPAGIHIKNLSTTNPIQINDKITKEDVILKEGDKITIGNNTFIFSEENIPNLFLTNPPNAKTPATTPLTATSEPPQEKFNTIFEENLEELPITLSPDKRFLIKVISGPNAGAEFGMDINKTYTIGKDIKNADIIFTDLTVSKKHAKITIDSKGILFIEDLNSKNKTLINSSPIEGKKIITPQDLITLGTSSFFIIDREKNTETIYAPKNLYPLKEEEKTQKEEPQLPWTKKPLPFKYVALISAAIFTLFIIFLSFFSLFKTETIPIVKEDHSKEIEKILKHYESIQFAFNPMINNLFLTGHILTIVDHKELRYALNGLTFIEKVEDNIIVDELVWKNANDTIRATDKFKNVSITSPIAGKYVLNGYLASTKDEEELLAYLNTNFPYMDRLSNQIIVEAILNEQITAAIFTNGFSNIQFQLSNGEVILSGLYPKEMEKKFSELLSTINKTKGVRLVKNLAIKTGEDDARIDLSKKYAVSGQASSNGQNFSIIINSQIYILGDLIDGMKITEIKENIILLEKDGLKYKINYNQ